MYTYEEYNSQILKLFWSRVDSLSDRLTGSETETRLCLTLYNSTAAQTSSSKVTEQLNPHISELFKQNLIWIRLLGFREVAIMVAMDWWLMFIDYY